MRTCARNNYYHEAMGPVVTTGVESTTADSRGEGRQATRTQVRRSEDDLFWGSPLLQVQQRIFDFPRNVVHFAQP